MERVARGQTTAEIARSLVVGRSTVESHIRVARTRTGAQTRVQAAALATMEAEPGAHGDVIVRPRAAGDLTIERGSATAPVKVSLGAVPSTPWWLGADHLVEGTVESDDDVSAAVLAIVRGAAVRLTVPTEGLPAVAGLVDALRRLGLDVGTDAAPEIPLADDDRRLLDLLGAGASIDEVARTLGYSRRTIQRRLEAARRHLGVATNREAIAVVAGLRPPPG